MKNKLPFAHILLGSFFIVSTAQSQNDHFAYAVTDLQKDGSGWNSLRKLNLQTGLYSDVLLKGSNIKQMIYDHATKKQLEVKTDAMHGNYVQAPFSTGVAAIAYDKKNDRLYYTPMFINQLRYIDLSSMKVFYITDKSFTSKGNMQYNQGKIITRMAIAPDGYGYAISNDASIFIRFTIGKETIITELGSLTDDSDNDGNSIHNRNTSYGGDMVADDLGNLYLISARSHVFKINIGTKVAKHLGKITGLPANYSTNGMVVNEEGKLLVSSASSSEAIYTIDPENWRATKFKSANIFFSSSDLANSNILSSKFKNNATEISTIAISDKVRLYPNPVPNSVFTIQFGKLSAGDYTIRITDEMGRQIQQRKVNINNRYHTETIYLSPASANGVFLLRLMDRKGKGVFSKKLVVQ
jgi:hypothetical protein